MGKHDKKPVRGSTSGTSIRKRQQQEEFDAEAMEKLDLAIKDNHDFPPKSGELK